MATISLRTSGARSVPASVFGQHGCAIQTYNHIVQKHSTCATKHCFFLADVVCGCGRSGIQTCITTRVNMRIAHPFSTRPRFDQQFEKPTYNVRCNCAVELIEFNFCLVHLPGLALQLQPRHTAG